MAERFRAHSPQTPGNVAGGVDAGQGGLGGGQQQAVAFAAEFVLVVDLGRRVVATGPQDHWLGRCEASVLVISGDAAAALHARAHAARLVEVTSGRLGVVVVGSGAGTSDEIAAFTGIRALGDVPFDPRSAAVASGASGAGRRLERSALLAAVRRIALRLEDRTAELVPRDTEPGDRGHTDGPAAVAGPAPDPVSYGTNGRAGVVVR